jgi:hypothetical protein
MDYGLHDVPVHATSSQSKQAALEGSEHQNEVLPSDMVENSTCSLRRHFELDVCHWTVRIGHLLPGEAPSEFFCWHLHWLPRDMTLQALLASVAFKQKPTAMGMRVPRVPSIVDVFSRLPLPEFAADNVAPPVCHLAATGCTSATRSDW